MPILDKKRENVKRELDDAWLDFIITGNPAAITRISTELAIYGDKLTIEEFVEYRERIRFYNP